MACNHDITLPLLCSGPRVPVTIGPSLPSYNLLTLSPADKLICLDSTGVHVPYSRMAPLKQRRSLSNCGEARVSPHPTVWIGGPQAGSLILPCCRRRSRYKETVLDKNHQFPPELVLLQAWRRRLIYPSPQTRSPPIVHRARLCASASFLLSYDSGAEAVARQSGWCISQTGEEDPPLSTYGRVNFSASQLLPG